MKIRLLLFALIFSLSLAPLRAQQQLAQKTEPRALTVAGLSQPVTVRRDERGIPYIEAANEADLYFAQGYITASDRLWQMELLRRTARGELAEIFGAGPQDFALESDKQHRRYGFARLAEKQESTLPQGIRAALEAYARGVNAYAASLTDKQLPPEFQILQLKPRPWRPADSLAVGKLFDETLSTSWPADLTRAAFADLPPQVRQQLFPETSPLDVLLVGSDRPANNKTSSLPSTAPVAADTLQTLSREEAVRRDALGRVGLYALDCAASNNWVVSGKHTITGQPLLANDPHLSASAPSVWYMVHLSTPGNRVAGVSVAGLPGVAIGHNEQLAWGVTSLEPDTQDLYVEKFDTANPRRYMTPSGWREAEVRREEIRVRKSPLSTETETVPFEVTVTRHGPIILEREGKRYALQWAALDPQASMADSFYLINYARDWDGLRAAFRNYGGPAFNIVYADVRGHIGYQSIGRFPVRKTGTGTVPYDGSTDDGEWTGYVPYDGLPTLYDPPSGIIVTANSRITGADYPHKLTVMPLAAYRARRIQELLESRPKHSIQDFLNIQGDTYSISGALFAREIAEIASEDKTQGGTDPTWLAAVALISEWDAKVEPDSRAALLASHMRDAFRRRVVAAVVGAERARRYRYSNSDTFVDWLLETRPREWLPKEFISYAALMRASLMEAREELTKEYGADESRWTWGREAVVRFPHPLAGAPLVGQMFTIEPFPERGGLDKLVSVNRGSAVSMRLVADVSDWDKTRQGIALGVSGLPSSPHWKDQLDDWRNVTPRPFPFTKAAVTAAAKETLVLEPATR